MSQVSEAKAPGAFLEECYERFSLATIDQRKIKGVIEWSDRLWVCLGISHQYMQVKSATLYEVFPVEPSKRDRKYKSGDGYAGLRATHGKQTYQIGSARVHVLRDAGGLCDRCQIREPKHDAACDTRLCDECVGEMEQKREEIRYMATRTKTKTKVKAKKKAAKVKKPGYPTAPTVDVEWYLERARTECADDFDDMVQEFAEDVEKWRVGPRPKMSATDSWVTYYAHEEEVTKFKNAPESADLREVYGTGEAFDAMFVAALVALDKIDAVTRAGDAEEEEHPPTPPSKGDMEGDPTVSAATDDREPGDEVLEGDFSKLPDDTKVTDPETDLVLASLQESRKEVKRELGDEYWSTLSEFCQAIQGWNGPLGKNETWLDDMDVQSAAFARSDAAKAFREKYPRPQFDRIFLVASLALHEGEQAGVEGEQRTIPETEPTIPMVSDDDLVAWLNSPGTVNLKSCLKHLQAIALDDDKLPQLSHVLLEVIAGRVEATALDGKRALRVRLGSGDPLPAGFRVAVRGADIKTLCGAVRAKDEEEGMTITIESETGKAVGKIFDVNGDLLRMDVMTSPDDFKAPPAGKIIDEAITRDGNRRIAVNPFYMGELLIKMAQSCGMTRGGFVEPAWLEIPEDREQAIAIRMANTPAKMTCEGVVMPMRDKDE